MSRIIMIASLLVLFSSCRKEPIIGYEVHINNCQSPYEMTFENKSTGFSHYEWNIDGEIFENQDPTVFLTDDEKHYMALTVYNGRKKSVHTEIFNVSDYYELPTANFSWGYPNCENFRHVNFKNKSSGIITGYYWDFGDGTFSTETAPYHKFPEAGNYVVVLHTYRCQDTVTATRTVKIDQSLVMPNANFSFEKYGSNPSGNVMLVGNSVRFKNQSSYSSSFLWRLDGATYSTETSPKQKLNTVGEYEIELVSMCSGFRDSIKKTLKVREPSSVTVSSIDLSSVPTEKFWDEEEYDSTDMDEWHPDIYFTLFKGSCVLFTSSVKENNESSSLSFSVGTDLSVLSGDYTITVYDEDESGSEEIGSATFSPEDHYSPGNYPESISASGDVDISIGISWN